MKAVIVASGELDAADAAWLADADLVVAADGGATSLDALGRRPDLLVGDMDSTASSLVERLASTGTRVVRHPADKDASDTALAVDEALSAGASELVILGAVRGERLDHALANLLLLAGPQMAGCTVRAVHGPMRVRALRAGERLALEGAIGDLVTLLPIGDATGVTTTDLRWPLDAATLPMGSTRGLSNLIDGPSASVRIDGGTLLVVETASKGANR
jgi:thiamine pyrophosphokinase